MWGILASTDWNGCRNSITHLEELWATVSWQMAAVWIPALRLHLRATPAADEVPGGVSPGHGMCWILKISLTFPHMLAVLQMLVTSCKPTLKKVKMQFWINARRCLWTYRYSTHTDPTILDISRCRMKTLMDRLERSIETSQKFVYFFSWMNKNS